ncbi:MAG: RDD family protein [Proteobacteria bacterium]|nr:RDD family protein [Pseudomonadota bacterium]
MQGTGEQPVSGPGETESRVKPTQRIGMCLYRAGALVLDVALLIGAGHLLGWVLTDHIAEMGQYSRLIGPCTALIYFTVMNSRVCGGRTIGKRLTGLTVVGADGTPISLARSFARHLILIGPLGVGVLQLSWRYPYSGGYALLESASGILVIASVYLYLFNRSGQLVHDLVVQTWVLRSTDDNLNLPKIWPAHLAVLIAIALTVFRPGDVLEPETDQIIWDFFLARQRAAEMVALQPLQGIAEIAHAETFRSITGPIGHPREGVTITLRENVIEDTALAKTIAGTVLENLPIDHDGYLQILMRYGYDVGTAFHWEEQAHTFAASDFENCCPQHPLPVWAQRRGTL